MDASELNEPEEIKQEAEKLQLDQDKLDRYLFNLRSEQNLPLGILACVVSALAGGIVWALITVATKYQIGYMAVAVGFLVGYANRYFGKGIDKIHGIIGAVFALLGCILGNLFSTAGFASEQESVGLMTVLGTLFSNFSMITSILKETFQPMDILFYGIAIYEGYRFSFREITEEEIIANAKADAPSV